MSMSEVSNSRQQKKCYQCRKDKKKCERREPWPANCVRCETALHYQCSEDLTMADYNVWQGHNLHVRPVSEHESSNANSPGNTRLSTNLETTVPSFVSRPIAVLASGVSTNTTLRPYTNVQASHTPRTTTQVAMVGTATPLSAGLHTSSTLGSGHGIDLRESSTSTTSSLHQSMGDAWQESSAGWESNPMMAGISTPATRTQQGVGEERNKNAEPLYEAIKRADYNQVEKLLNNRNPGLNPMEVETVRVKAVDITLQAMAKYSDPLPARPGQPTTLPRILQKLLEHGAIDHVIRYRFPLGRTILLELYNPQSLLHEARQTILLEARQRILGEIIETWVNSSLRGVGDLILALDFGGGSLLHRPSCPGTFRRCFKPLLPKFLNELKTLCNTQDDAGDLPLHFAHDDMDVFNFLLEHTQNPFTGNQEQRTPLHSIVNRISETLTACKLQAKLLQQLRVLLQLGNWQEVCDMRDKDGRTLVHLATNLYVLKELLKLPRSRPYSLAAIIDAQDNDGQTPLHRICSGRGLRRNSYSSMWFLAEHLILRGADVTKKDSFGRNPLLYLLDAMDGSILPRSRYFYPLAMDPNEDEPGQVPVLLRDCRMARRLTTLLLEGGVGVDEEDIDGISARSSVEQYWDRWKKSQIFRVDRYMAEFAEFDLHPMEWLEHFMSGTLEFDPQLYPNSITHSPSGLSWYELTCPHLAQLRLQLRGRLTWESSLKESAELFCKIIKEDLEALVNAIRGKSTRKRKRDSTSDPVLVEMLSLGHSHRSHLQGSGTTMPKGGYFGLA